MKTEVEVAARWWAQRLTGLPHQSMVESFETALVSEMTARYDGHWYPETPTRGGGYRSVVCDQRQVDTLLERAGRKAGIMQLRRYLKDEHVMFVNPGAVRVRSLAYFHAPTQTLYEADGAGDEADLQGELQEPGSVADAPSGAGAPPASKTAAAAATSGGPRSPVFPAGKGRGSAAAAHGTEGLSVGA